MQIANITRDGVLSLYARDMEPGDMGEVIAIGRVGAVVVADAYLAEHLDRLPLGLTDPDENALERLTDAVKTCLEDEDTAEMTLGRLGQSEPLDAGANAWNDGLRGHNIERWTRNVNEGACELCQSLTTDESLPSSV